MSARTSTLVAILAALTGPALGFGHGFRHRAEAFYYYPEPAVAVPTAPMAAPVAVEPPLLSPVPAAPCPAAGPAAPTGPLYAQPTPAPPSTVPSLPLRSTPGVTESRSFYGESYTASYSPSVPEPPLPRNPAQVGFWNLSGRDVLLRVGGRTETLPNGVGVRVPVDHQFVWQVDDRPPENETVPERMPSMEIVIRR